MDGPSEHREPFWSDQRPAVAVATAIAIALSFAAPFPIRGEIIIHALGAAITLWWPWFWVWDVPRKLHMQPAPIEYVYVFGWGAMVIACIRGFYHLAV
jgi:hypothetical protein